MMAWLWMMPVGISSAYFLVLSVLGSLLLWLAPRAAAAHLTFLDALFNAVSALTNTCLGSVPMHRFALFDQTIILFLMLLGGQAFTSAIPLVLRRLIGLLHKEQLCALVCGESAEPHMQRSPKNDHKTLCSGQPAGGAALPLSTVDELQRDSLEHEALVTMSWLTVLYFVFAISFGFLVCQLCLINSPQAYAVLTQNQVRSSFFSIFTTVSALGNCGFTPLDENMVPMQRSRAILLCVTALMLMGNTLYAPSLRLWVWILHKCSKIGRKQVFAHILDCEERQFTHIFPSTATKWLVSSVVVLIACQMLCMLGIDWSSEALRGLSSRNKLVDALFQSVSARFGGFNVVNLAGFSSATLFISLVAMYIKAYPIGSLKSPQLCHARSLLAQQASKLKKKNCFLAAAIFLICLCERKSMRRDPINFAFFNVVFEVISAYANVGLSIGYSCNLKVASPDKKCEDMASSFSGRWSDGGKLVLIVVMLLGRSQYILEDIDWASILLMVGKRPRSFKCKTSLLLQLRTPSSLPA